MLQFRNGCRDTRTRGKTSYLGILLYIHVHTYIRLSHIKFVGYNERIYRKKYHWNAGFFFVLRVFLKGLGEHSKFLI